MNAIWHGHEPDPDSVPPLPANLGQACYKCFTEESSETPLSTCGSCRRIAYCSPECQRADWPSHMPVCQALVKLEDSDNTFQSDLYSTSLALAIINPVARKALIKRMIQIDIEDFETLLLEEGCSLGAMERELFYREPRCTICGITDRLIRIRHRLRIDIPAPKPRLLNGKGTPLPSPTNSTSVTPHPLEPCPRCKTTFSCSPEHLALASIAHSQLEIQGQPGHSASAFTQCELNQRLRDSILLHHTLSRLQRTVSESTSTVTPYIHANGRVQWVPSRIKERWSSLKGKTWEDEFLEEVKKAFPLVWTNALKDPCRALLREASESLSIPMTILWALEVLNGSDLRWTKKATLRIQVLEASATILRSNIVFEEIMHQLPEMRHLEVTMFGADVAYMMLGNTTDTVELQMPVCLECRRRGRQRTQLHSSMYYHEFVKEQGSALAKPDLVVALDAGSGQSGAKCWADTLHALRKMGVPTLFTASTQEQAINDAKHLRKSGLRLLKVLGPLPNPWASMELQTDTNTIGVESFFTTNGWIVGGSH